MIKELPSNIFSTIQEFHNHFYLSIQFSLSSFLNHSFFLYRDAPNAQKAPNDEFPKEIGGTYEDRMINNISRYLSHSRENFSNIVLSVPSDNGISILTGADKQPSRTYPAPRARV